MSENVKIAPGSGAEARIRSMVNHPAAKGKSVKVTPFAADNNIVRIGYAGSDKTYVAVNV